MNVVKITVNEDGNILQMVPDFKIMRGCYRNVLINVEVPRSLLVDEVKDIESNNSIVGNNVRIGAIISTATGHNLQTKKYEMHWVKDYELDNVEYSLYQRIMPKEFTMWDTVNSYEASMSGALSMVINIVNFAKNDGKIKMEQIIASPIVTMDIYPSIFFDDEEVQDASDFDMLVNQTQEIEKRVNVIDTELEDINIEVVNVNTKLHSTKIELDDTNNKAGVVNTKLENTIRELSDTNIELNSINFKLEDAKIDLSNFIKLLKSKQGWEEIGTYVVTDKNLPLKELIQSGKILEEIIMERPPEGSLESPITAMRVILDNKSNIEFMRILLNLIIVLEPKPGESPLSIRLKSTDLVDKSNIVHYDDDYYQTDMKTIADKLDEIDPIKLNVYNIMKFFDCNEEDLNELSELVAILKNNESGIASILAEIATKLSKAEHNADKQEILDKIGTETSKALELAKDNAKSQYVPLQGHTKFTVDEKKKLEELTVADYNFNSKASAITETVSGEFVTVDNTDSELQAEVSIRSTNILKPYISKGFFFNSEIGTTLPEPNIDLEIMNNTFALDPNQYFCYLFKIPTVIGEKYNISFTADNTATALSLYGTEYDNAIKNNYYAAQNIASVNRNITAINNFLWVAIAKNNTFSENIVHELLVTKSQSKKPYTSYKEDGTAVELQVNGANLFAPKSFTKTIGELTYSYDAEKQIMTFNGKQTAVSSFAYIPVQDTLIKNYYSYLTCTARVISGEANFVTTNVGNLSNVCIGGYSSRDKPNAWRGAVIFPKGKIQKGDIILGTTYLSSVNAPLGAFYIYMPASEIGTTYNQLQIKFDLRIGNLKTALPYEAYQGEVYNTTVGSTVNVNQYSPQTNISTNLSGVYLDVVSRLSTKLMLNEKVEIEYGVAQPVTTKPYPRLWIQPVTGGVKYYFCKANADGSIVANWEVQVL